MNLHKKIMLLKACNFVLKKDEEKVKNKGLLHSIFGNDQVDEEKILSSIYNEVIENYNNSINKTFNFEGPVEISQAYIFAYKNGFLSKDFSFSYSINHEEIVNYLWLMGATVFTGKGCCRHTSQLLSDIYNNYGFSSTPIATGFNQHKMNINFEDLPKSSLDFIKSLDLSNITDNELISLLSNNGVPMSLAWEYDRKKVPNNHSITGVSHNGFAYYVDPTNNDYYKMNKEVGRLVDRTGNVENTIKTPLFAASDSIHDKKKIKELSSLLSADLDSVKSICMDTNLLCKKNYDLFEQFYKENHEAYEEITEKLKKIVLVNKY